ncbi:sigma-70, region 4 [Leptospira ryugenii]|uniref:Sigma-70, region 4 n=1 Tax=Leptospira ryugenii TaxID=1917863 RepID=A0A2P2E2D4_9LEPT|nr:sigma-70 family RNA polymerase sigma factor [Leptospira ryugenii]GBF51073.1 sigma-70, region 4 [Leptospira ryugenii]
MNDQELARTIEETKETVLRAIHKNLPADLFALVEDVFQETYLRLYLHFSEKEVILGEGLHKWLYVVARNECRRAWRDNRKAGGLPFTGDLENIESPFTYVGEEINREEKDAIWIRERVNELPEPFRQTTIFRLAGLKVQSIAEKLGVSTGTVKSRLARGREMLAKLINKNKKERELDL